MDIAGNDIRLGLTDGCNEGGFLFDELGNRARGERTTATIEMRSR